MQPWDFIVIRDPAIRHEVRNNFERANQQASSIYEGEKKSLYDNLKLAAIVESPMNLCVTCDHHRTRGSGLGRQSNPTTDLHSTVCAVQNLWLAARAESLGVGWVSILDLDALKATLQIPPEVTPVAYLCIGYVSEFGSQPGLEKRGWEHREALANLILHDRWTNNPKVTHGAGRSVLVAIGAPRRIQNESRRGTHECSHCVPNNMVMKIKTCLRRRLLHSRVRAPHS